MPTTINLTNSMNFCRPILKNQNLMISGMEPALTIGNILLRRMLSAPFKWRFNRNTFSFQTVLTTNPPTTDYDLTLADFGHMENQWIADANGNIFELNRAVALAPGSTPSTPNQIAPQYETAAVGSITFRLRPSPDAVYTVNGDYQMKATTLVSPATLWSPVTDEFAHIYHFGFLALSSLVVNDSRFPVFEGWFLGSLLSAQDGLSDQERDIFLEQWARTTAGLARSQGMVQLAQSARGR